MFHRQQRKILALIIMSVIGVGLGVWLFRAGFTLLGCVYMGLFLWRGQQFAVWLIAPKLAPPDATPAMNSSRQRILLSLICFLGSAVCALGVYLWHLWPEEWQAGLVFILFGFIVLTPVTIWQIQNLKTR